MAKKEVTNKESFSEKLKRFWQGTKRAYKRFRILFHMLFIAIFMMCVVGALYLGLEWGTRHGEEITLPDFVGMDIDDARALAEEKGLEILTEHFDGTLLCLLGEQGPDLPLQRGLEEAVVGILGGGTDEGHGRGTRTEHPTPQGDESGLPIQLRLYLQDLFPLPPVDGKDLMPLKFT